MNCTPLTNTLLNTEDENSPNLMAEIIPNTPLIIAFTGMARGLNELANFEFVKSTRGFSCSKIFCRDPNLAFYHLGIDNETSSVVDVLHKLKGQVEKAAPTRVTCVGVSAGGFAALLFGHLLKADMVHAFGPQTILYKDWGVSHKDPTVYTCENLHAAVLMPGNDFRDLNPVLSNYNGKTSYKVHIGTGVDCEQDGHHADNISACEGVEVLTYPCDGHACAVAFVKDKGVLGQLVLGVSDEDSGL